MRRESLMKQWSPLQCKRQTWIVWKQNDSETQKIPKKWWHGLIKQKYINNNWAYSKNQWTNSKTKRMNFGRKNGTIHEETFLCNGITEVATRVKYSLEKAWKIRGKKVEAIGLPPQNTACRRKPQSNHHWLLERQKIGWQSPKWYSNWQPQGGRTLSGLGLRQGLTWNR